MWRCLHCSLTTNEKYERVQQQSNCENNVRKPEEEDEKKKQMRQVCFGLPKGTKAYSNESDFFYVVIVAMLSLLRSFFFPLVLLLVVVLSLLRDLVSSEQTISLKIISSICWWLLAIVRKHFSIKRSIFSSPMRKEKILYRKKRWQNNYWLLHSRPGFIRTASIFRCYFHFRGNHSFKQEQWTRANQHAT